MVCLINKLLNIKDLYVPLLTIVIVKTLNKKKIIDFSSKSNNIVMTDYELAFFTST